MAQLGADPSDLRELARALSHTQRQLNRTGRNVTRRLRAARWIGHDGDRFRAAWEGHARALRHVGEGLVEASHDLERNAGEQERVSGSGASAHRGGRDDIPGQLVSAGRRTDPPPMGDALPLRTETWVLGAEAAAVLGLAAGTRLTVTTLSGGRSAVTIENHVGGSVSGGIGAEAGLRDGIALEFEAHTSAEASFVQRRSWLIEDAEVGSFLMKLGLAENIDHTPAIGRNPLTGLAADRIMDALGLGTGEPDTTDAMFEMHGDLGADATALVPLVGLSGAGMGAIGLRSRRSGMSLVLEGTTEWDADALGAGPSGSRTTTLEIPLAEGGAAQHLVVTTSTTDGRTEVLERQVFELDRADNSRPIAEAADDLLAGNPLGAIDALAPVLQSMPGESVWQDSTIGVVSDDTHGVDIGILLGPKLGGSVEAGRTVTDYSGLPVTGATVPGGSGGGSW